MSERLTTHEESVFRYLDERGSMTPKRLIDCTGWLPGHLGSLLIGLETKRRVILHPDSTADKRMGGLTLADGRSVTLVGLRRDR